MVRGTHGNDYSGSGLDLESSKQDSPQEEYEMYEKPERTNTRQDSMADGAKMSRTTTLESVHETFSMKLFLALTAMSFLWIGSQLPLYLVGGILPDIYSDIGGYDRWVWIPIAYFIPVAALCPFVGELSDLFGRKIVGLVGQMFLIIGPIIVSTAYTMNVAIGGMVIAGAGAGLNELISLAATGEMVPTAKRGFYVGAVVLTILPFAPSVLWAQLIVSAASWRYVGAFIAGWNVLGLIFLMLFYHPLPRPNTGGWKRSEILKHVDYVGGVLSIGGVMCFMMGLQWGAQQYQWSSAHVLAPFFVGVVLIIAYFFWEIFGAKDPMVPGRIFSRAKRTMIVTLLITFFSGANFFNMLLFWPTEIFNVYGDDRIGIGIRSLPVGFGILGGAVIALVLIPITKGNIRAIMVFFCAMMTAGTGATAIARPDNIMTAYAPVCLACIGVGGVIIPVAIIAQIICPDDLIGTITAISLSIRFVGGAIGFSVYYNIFYKHVYENVQNSVAYNTIIWQLGYVEGLSQGDQSFVTNLAQSIAQAQYSIFNRLSEAAWKTAEVQARVPGITLDAFRWQITNATEWAQAEAYQWPYWISIAFGGTCFILAFFLGDLSPYLDEHVAAHI